MAEEDKDNDTVFLKGSPLYELFKNNDIGLGEFETSRKCDESVTRPLLNIETDSNLPTPSWLEYFKDNVKRLSRYFVLEEPVDNWPVYETVTNLLVESKVLHSEDQALLKGFLEEYNFKNRPVSTVKTSYYYLRKRAINAGIFLISMILLTYFFPCLENCPVIWHTQTIFCLFWILVPYCYRKNQLELRYHRRIDFISKLELFLPNLKEFWKLTRKSLRTIQESEVIARGLTFVTVRNTSLESNSVLPSRHREKQCPELRSSVFKHCSKHFFACRDATAHLLKIFPLTEGFDMESHYLSNMKLEELGPLVRVNVDSKEMLEITEHFSTPALKAMIELTKAQESELLRRIAFCFLSDNNPIRIYDEVIKVTKLILVNLNSAKSGLDKILLYYSLSGRNNEFKREPSTKREGDDPIQSFRTSVRSLSLHLQASLVRLQELENCLEVNENEEFSVLKDIVGSLGTQYLTEVKSELEAATVCYEDSLVRSLHIIEGIPLKKTTPCPITDLDTELIKSNKSSIPPINLLEMGDPVVEDQVFEGSAEYSPDNEESYDDLLPPLSKKAPRILLNELKTVLAVKAEERKVREAKVLGIDPSEIPDNQILTPDKPTNIVNDSESRGKTERTLLSKETFEELKIKAESGSSSFMTSIAAQAALRSQTFGGVNCNEDIIADSDSE